MSIQAEQQLEQDYIDVPEEDIQQVITQPFKTKMNSCEMCEEPALDVTMQTVDGLLSLCPQCSRYIKQIPDGLLKESFKQRLIGNIL